MENIKKRNTKKILLGGIIGILIGTLMSVSYAFFSYSRTGLNNKLIVGDIYMRYKESSRSINFQNAMPSNTYIANQYFEFDIIGKNTNTIKDIIYDIVLNYGDNHETRTTRIRDDLLKFRLVTVNNDVETEIFNNQSYTSINNKRIHATTIPKNTTVESTTTYRLYAWISNDTIIGTGADADYSQAEWEDVYASIKVNVTGDFTEKSLVATPVATPASCFTTETNNNEITITKYNVKTLQNATLASDMETNQNKMNACVSYFNTEEYWQGFGDFLQENGESLQSFCKGTGTGNGATFQEWINNGIFSSKDFNYFYNEGIITGGEWINEECGTDIVIPSTINDLSVTTIGESAFALNGLTSVEIPNSVTTIQSGAFADNQLTSLTLGNSVTTIGESAFALNGLTSLTLGNSVTSIGHDAFHDSSISNLVLNMSDLDDLDLSTFKFDSNGLSLTINNATTIPDSMFENMNITSLTLGNSVITIEYSAFYNNQLTSLTLGNSVTTIGGKAFEENQLTSVTVPNSVLDSPWDGATFCFYFDVGVNVTWNGTTTECAEESAY